MTDYERELVREILAELDRLNQARTAYLEAGQRVYERIRAIGRLLIGEDNDATGTAEKPS